MENEGRGDRINKIKPFNSRLYLYASSACGAYNSVGQQSYSTDHSVCSTEILNSPFSILNFKKGLPKQSFSYMNNINYSLIAITAPEPTVLPPSRIAKRRPTSIAIGVISSTSISTLSPGIHISVPSGREIVPVTSVVLK